MTYVNSDSILVYSYSNRQAYLLNTRGIVYDSFKLSIPLPDSLSKVWYPSPIVSNNSPLALHQNKVYFTGFLSGESKNEDFHKRYLMASYSLDKRNCDFQTLYPPLYENKNYGGFYFRQPYSTVNYKTGNSFISLPASHNIIQFNLADTTKELINLSPPFAISIPSIRFPKEQNFAVDKIAEHFSTNFSYKNIIYHPYKDVYIRILEKPIKQENLKTSKLGYKDCILLLYDSKFKYIGKSSLDRYLSTDNYFITRTGIYFMRGDNRKENIGQYVFYEIN